MIFDTFENADKYLASFPALGQAVAFVQKFDTETPDGKYEIDGENSFALVQSYETKSAGEVPFEAHKKFADVQILLAGSEQIGVTQDSDLTVKQPFSAETDCALFEAPEEYTSVAMKPGCFLLLLPQDAHQPCVKIAQSMAVKKVVVKIRL